MMKRIICLLWRRARAFGKDFCYAMTSILGEITILLCAVGPSSRAEEALGILEVSTCELRREVDKMVELYYTMPS